MDAEPFLFVAYAVQATGAYSFEHAPAAYKYQLILPAYRFRAHPANIAF